jgi:hypothetical protein
MTFQPGQSGNPNGYAGPRIRRHREILEHIKSLGHRDCLVTLSTIQNNDETEPGLRIAAAAALAPFAHPKLQAIPVAYYIEHPVDIPQFRTISEAADYLAKIPSLYASGQLDAASSDRLSAQITNWIEAKKASEFEERLTIVEQNLNLSQSTRPVNGGLPSLPGTDVIMPNGRAIPSALPAPDDKPPINGHDPDPDP